MSELKASFTLEASVIIPLVTGFFVALLFFFRVLQIETQIYSALSYASRKTAAMMCTSDSEVASYAMAEAYFRKAIANDEEIAKYIEGGSVGISLAGSDFSGEYIDLQASYKISLPIHFFHISGIHMSQVSKSRKWIGDIKKDKKTDMVYVTAEGEVYHTTKYCNHLDLSIQLAYVAQIGHLRNKNGHKYYECEQCVANISDNVQVYITNYGTVYHGDIHCAGLKRTIYEIPFSEIGARAPCKKCAI